MADRPTFLSIIAILLGIYGILSLIGGIALVVMGNDSVFKDMGLNADFLKVAGLLAIVVGIIALACAYFLWKGVKIGWYLSVIFLIINAIEGILTLMSGAILLLISVILLWYFFRPKVRAFFGT